MRAFLRQRGQILRAVIICTGESSAPAPGLLEIAFGRAMGVKVVLEHRNTGLARDFNRLLDLVDFFIAAGPSVGCIGESADEQVAQGQATGFELIAGRLKVTCLPGKSRSVGENMVDTHLHDGTHFLVRDAIAQIDLASNFRSGSALLGHAFAEPPGLVSGLRFLCARKCGD
jgi:hypothetical protein